MKKIATLGPPGTFSARATLHYLATHDEPHDIEYFPSIEKTLQAIGNDCEIGILPIENFSEGFIPLMLDRLVDTELIIVGEVLLPIQFSFVSQTRELPDIHQLFVQFVAKGQCRKFIQTLGPIEIVTTESNIESLERARSAEGKSAAIVPSGSFSPEDFPAVAENINDYKDNQTRFLALSCRGNASALNREGEYKTSIIVLDDHDHPGLLCEILHSFSKRRINLTSIISRPSRKQFGKYHFFIDLDGRIQDPAVSDALEEIRRINNVKFLGSYPKGKLLRT